MTNLSNKNLLVILLWIFVIHSAIIAILLIFLPLDFLHYFGYHNYHGRFFQVQGGVFHLVMAAAYVIAVLKIDKALLLIIFIIIAKSIATIFLFIYFFFYEPIWILLPSAASDGAMAILLFIFHKRYRKERINN